MLSYYCQSQQCIFSVWQDKKSFVEAFDKIEQWSCVKYSMELAKDRWE